MEDGKMVQVDAKEYMESLKEEARALKEALRREKVGAAPMASINGGSPNGTSSKGGGGNNSYGEMSGSITGYIASRQGDVKSLTKGVSPEILETMKRLVAFVLEGGDSGKAAKKGMTTQEKAEMEMEIPGTALQQLALWQLVLGYRLREAEVKGDYLRILE
jgi:hypothetical protein